MKKKMNGLLCGLAVLLSAGLSFAQDPGMGDMVFSAGTVASVSSGSSTQQWAWVQWMATDSGLIKNQPVDVYMKIGDTLSTNLFTLKGRAAQVTDPRTIALLLERGEMLGEDLINLESALCSLYAGAEPNSDLSMAEKISAVISGSQSDDKLYENLVFVSRIHPSLAMAIGQAFACPIPSSGFVTFELRDGNTSELIGRITLEAGNPVVLPAPGPLILVPETSPKGNLNIRFRWEIPDNLKRLSLLQFGYNLYRVNKSSAEAWWGPTPAPTTAALLYAVDHYETAVKVNRIPVLVDPSTVTTNSWFIADDNDGLSGGTPFEDTENYYYFVTALDLLGRDGDVSAGFLTYPHDRMAPPVPHGLKARSVSDYVSGVQTQWIELVWNHDPADTDTARYYVYRFESISEMQQNAVYALSNRISGAVVPDPDATRVEYEDRSLNTNAAGITYWYTVRAEDNARGEPNLSGNSAPAYGVLRDWAGPQYSTGAVVTIQTESVYTEYERRDEGTQMEGINTVLLCDKSKPDNDIIWADFGWCRGDYRPGCETGIVSIVRVYYPERSSIVSNCYLIDNEDGYQFSQITFFCRVGTGNGKQSEWAHYSTKTPSADSPAIYYFFKAWRTVQRVPVEGGGPGEPPGSGPHLWGDPLTFPQISIPPTADAESYRLYRRVDGGRRALIAQGEMDELLGALVTDYTGGSVNGGRICYYYQLFDQHGNSGPMVLICCFEVEPRVDLPVPLLSPVRSTGEATNSPGMTVEWFCTTPGVERFELALAADSGDLPATFSVNGWELEEDRTNALDVVINGVTNQMNFGFYRSGRVGTVFGTNDSPLFTVPASSELNRQYTFMVRVIGAGGVAGDWSNIEQFRWASIPAVPGPQVPWPARPMPTVQTRAFHASMRAEFLTDSKYLGISYDNRPGIRIGEVPSGISFEMSKDIVVFGDYYVPDVFLYQNVDDRSQTALNCVLYRYQLTNELFLTVSGDVAQVSPLMETIAYGKNGSGHTVIYDPFICFTRERGSTEPWGVYLVDTQPVVRGARYQYLLVWFNPATREPERIIPAGELTIP